MSKRVFKFGGASVKDAQSIANVAHALKSEGHKDVCMVVSAMGKTTNAMEVVVADYLKAKNERRDVVEVINQSIAPVVDFHRSIIDELFGDRADQVRSDIERMFDEIVGFITWNKSLNKSFIYDQIVGYGELLSTRILSAYLAEVGIDNTWHDIRTLIKTDDSYRDAAVNWEATADKVSVLKDSKQLIVTQGFLGSDANNFTTTLGREGSDYTAAILAYALDASSVSIWKDVPGVLNADPRYFTKTQLLHQISYREAIELAFYGASVIHPKTLQPLQRKSIPLHVRSFVDLKAKGTTVTGGAALVPQVPCYIVKKNQVLLELATQDFSFMVEKHFSTLFNLFAKYRLKVDLIQNSAISFKVCLDNRFEGIDGLLPELEQGFKVNCHRGVSLYTIRHFDDESINEIPKSEGILVEQRADQTLQVVTFSKQKS